MSDFVKETAHLHIDMDKYGENFDHIFNCKDCKKLKTKCECEKEKPENGSSND